MHGASKPPSAKPSPTPTAEGPEIEAAKKNVYAQMLRKKGRAASDVTGGLALVQPANTAAPELQRKLGVRI